ncbi:MAG: glycosyltransferase [Lachnospiraceae bacterium]|nr:glycosyltransferase [Lachnospiraceae bacterium]
MKVDFLIPVGERGGVEKVVNRTAVYLQRNGWSVRVVQFVWEGASWLDEEIAFYPLIRGREGHDLQELAGACADFWDEQELPDVILAVAWPYVSYIAKQALWLYGSRRQQEVFRPVVSRLGAEVGEYERAGFGGMEALGFADAHFCISDRIADDVRKGTGCPRVFRVYNPVVMQDGEASDTAFYDSGSLRLLYLGRLSAEKHPETILEALAGEGCASWSLDVVGDGEEGFKQELKKKAKQLDLFDRIRWHGWKDQPWTAVDHISALVLASEYEGFPSVAVEALARGIPVIAPPLSGITDIVVPGTTGYLFRVGHAEELAKILSFWSSGLLPAIGEDACKEAAAPYRYEVALGDFAKKLAACAELG